MTHVLILISKAAEGGVRVCPIEFSNAKKAKAALEAVKEVAAKGRVVDAVQGVCVPK